VISPTRTAETATTLREPALNSWWPALTGRLSRVKAPFWLGAAIALGVAALGLVLLGGHKFVDLQVYRFGWQALWHGHDLYGVLPATSAGDHLPFIYPPFAAIAFAPVTVLPWAVAAVAMFALSIFALGLTLYLVARRVWAGGGPRGALALTAAALPPAVELEPVRSTLSFGQVNLVLMAMVAVDCLVPGRRRWRGLLIGLAAAIKITPAAFVLFFLVRKDYRGALNVLAGAGGALLAGFLFAPTASMQFWLGKFTHASGLSGSPYATNQTIEAALSRLQAGPVTHAVVWGVLVVAVFVSAVLVMRRCDPPMAMTVNAAGALVISPISWSHHWVWIAPALMTFLGRAAVSGNLRWALATALTAVLFVVAPFQMVPALNDRELHWTAWQHVVGNAYLIPTLLALFIAALRRAPSPSPSTPHLPDSAIAG
jgi:alpha-1,2-mannosyltransferase